MTAPGTWTPYSTIAPYLGKLPGWVPALDQERIAAYLKYDQIYWSSDEGYTEVFRGDNENPIMMPTARTLVNTLDRYTCPQFGYRVDGTGTQAQVLTLALENLFAREKFVPLFNAFKLEGSRFGDSLLHIVADMTKPLGRRLSLYKVDPAAYFPVYDEDDPTRIVKVHLAEQIVIGNDTFVSRLTYEKVLNEGDGSVIIMRSHGLYKTDDEWWGLAKPQRVILAEEALDPLIQSFPVYHYKNGDPTQPFGSSSMRGLESVFLGVNQSVSDEDLTLAMEGLGVYATDGGGPVDEAGNETDYITGPGRVLTHANGLRRVSGAGSVTPYGDHIDRLEEAAYGSVGASDVALGKDTSAEAGIALQIRLGPIMATTGKMDDELLGLMTQFFYDLQFWLQVYEELPLIQEVEGRSQPVVTLVPTLGQKMPVNLTEVIKNVVDLRNCVPPVISLRTSLALLRAAGMPVPDDEETQLATEAAAATGLDPLGEPSPLDDLAADDRVATELA